ncbi:MAG TPA: alkaline phosphatase family protein [Streptosporangiaceae bacterium]|nr:alkaline phosphatase family protein [Streptosporangiaceae bacterium]
MEIAHVVVLMLENRSYDHLLGFVPHPDPAFDGLTGKGPVTNPGWHQNPAVTASPDAKVVLPVGPDHSHDAVMEQLALTPDGKPTNQGFVVSYERKCRGQDPPAFAGLLGPLANLAQGFLAHGGPPVTGRGPLVMQCQPPEQVPVLAKLALEFAVCARWFCSVPGETWPNRNFAHAATSDGQTDIEIRPYTNQTIFEVLERSGADWRIYHDDTPQVWAFPALWDTPERHAKWFPLDQFASHAASGDLPQYTFIEPNHRPPLHTLDHDPVIGVPDVSNNQHPENNLVSNDAYDTFPPHTESDFAQAERLVATVYEALRSNPGLFATTVLLVTYDEHGGLFDHVPPPTGVPAPGGPSSRVGEVLGDLLHRRAGAFDFTMLGPRVPALVISPLVPARTVDTQIRDHASIPATLRALFAPDAGPLTGRDAWSPPFHDLLTLAEPRTDLPDLSDYASGAAPVLTAPPAPPVAPAPAAAGAEPREGAAAPPSVPPYYQAFTDLADQVERHLVAVSEPEAVTARATGGPVQRSTQISGVFAAAAQRHRTPAAQPAPQQP